MATESSAGAIASASSSNQNTSDCKKWFQSFINEEHVELSEEDLKNFLKNDLKISFKKTSLDEKYETILPSLLVGYIKSWPGWNLAQDHRDGKISFSNYYEKFREHLRQKLTTAVPNILEEAIKDTIGELQLEATNGKYNKEMAPFALKITCPAEMLSTMIFTSEGEDIILKQHLGKHWVGLDTTQLVNWPNIRVIFVSDELFFLRHQSVDYDRYLNFVPAEYKFEETIIERAEMISSRKIRHCYTHRLLEAYVTEYLETLKNSTKLAADKLEEIATILDQFLQDIKFLNIEPNQNIATNTKILFRMSPVSYIRNKKLVHSNPSEARIGYCEVLTPKVELLLRHFRGCENKNATNPNQRFNLSEKVLTIPSFSLIPKIYYKCCFCNRDFIDLTSKRDILFHLFFEHRMEQPLRCVRCKLHFDVTDLSKSRWQHVCDLKVPIKQDKTLSTDSGVKNEASTSSTAPINESEDIVIIDND